MDQQQTEDGKPYGPIRYKEIVDECCVISKNLNTPYTDVLNISPTERNYIIRFLIKEAEQKAALVEKARAESAANQRKY